MRGSDMSQNPSEAISQDKTEVKIFQLNPAAVSTGTPSPMGSGSSPRSKAQNPR